MIEGTFTFTVPGEEPQTFVVAGDERPFTIGDYKRIAGQIDEAARRDAHFDEVRERFRALDTDDTRIEDTKSREPRWYNVHREEVDLNNIDREYALNILMLAHANRVKMGYTREDFIEDRLIQKLRGIVLEGREKNLRDKIRGARYNLRCRVRGLPYRA
jgi:hypothetical protein